MHSLSRIELYFQQFIQEIWERPGDDMIEITLPLLQKMDLINDLDPSQDDPSLTRYFQVVETEEKITLINEEFIIWIVPDHIEDESITYTLIATNGLEIPQLELCFITSGVYNNSKLVLRVLEKFLEEIQENEKLIDGYQQEE